MFSATREKGYPQKTYSKHHVITELRNFSSGSGHNTAYMLIPFLFSIILEVLNNATRKIKC